MQEPTFSIVTVILRNNQRKVGYVWAENPNVVSVQLKNGMKDYTMEQIHHIEGMQEVSEKPSDVQHYINNKEETKVDFVHFINGNVRVLTNNPTAKELEAYLATKANPLAVANFTALNTGNFVPAFIMQRMPVDVKWRLTVIPFMDEQRNQVDIPVDVLAPLSSFFWANASHAFFLSINNSNEWGEVMELLGVDVFDAKKTAKRLNEIVRLTELWTEERPNVHIFDDEREKFFDGINVVSRSFARKMAMNIKRSADRRRTLRGINTGKLVRMNFRYMDENGLIKGDAIIVADQQIMRTWGADFDIIAHRANLKDEIMLTHGQMATGFWHHAFNTAVHDVQSMSWMKDWLFPVGHVLGTIKHVAEDFKATVSSGEIPSWITLGEDAHNDDGVLNLTGEKLSDAMGRNYMRWQMAGLDIKAANNLCYMASNGMVQRMQSKHDNRRQFWIPVSNAFYGHVVTFEFLTEICGFKFDSDKADKVFFDEATNSVVIPGERFDATYDLHGGWDLDDSAKFIRIKLDGEDKVVVLRSPNGMGEYSIEDVDVESMPWQFTDMDVLELSMKNAPKFLPEIMANTIIEGLPVAPKIERIPFSKARAMWVVETQSINPGIGGYANGMMTYYTLFNESPKTLLAGTEDIVDAVQQTVDADQFVAIKAASDKMMRKIQARVMAGAVPVDEYIIRNRAGFIANDLRDLNLLVNKGYFSEIEKFYLLMIEDMRNFNRQNWLSIRQQSELVAEVRKVQLGEDMLAKIKPFVAHAAKLIRQINNEYRDIKNMSRWQKMQMQMARKQALEGVVARMVNNINDQDDPGLFAVALYKFVTSPKATGEKYGISDQFIFQPAADGSDSVMDVLITGLINLGLAKELPALES